jgi:adenylate cyclase
MREDLQGVPQRKLAAILAADVVGYTKLMREDELGTLKAVSNLQRECIEPLVRFHNGRIFKTTGDGFLVEFQSVVAAVSCALELVEKLTALDHSEQRPHGNKMQLRVGINLGDIIHEGDDVFGDGVNLAARLESIAAPGTIVVSSDVYRQVVGKVTGSFADLGERQLKNISDPVRVFSVSSPTIGTFARPVSAETAVASVAVLPLLNMSGDPEQEYFSDGLTEDIITDLSKIPELFVIARNSTFTYKGKAIDIRRVGQDLGARFVVEGSVRKAGSRVRVTIQLIDAATGGHVWAERYDRELHDIFLVQDEVNNEIVSALQMKLRSKPSNRSSGRTMNVEAYELFLRARELYYRFAPSSNELAATLCRSSSAADGDYAEPYALLAQTYLLQWNLGWNFDPDQTLVPALRWATKAVEHNEGLASAHYSLGWVHLWQREHQKAIKELRRSIELDPSYAEGHAFFGMALAWAARAAEGIQHVRMALKLDPMYPPLYLYFLGASQCLADQDIDAVESLRRSAARDPLFMPTHGFLAGAYAKLNRLDEARLALKEMLRLNPNVTLESLPMLLPFADEVMQSRFVAAMEKAGLR